MRSRDALIKLAATLPAGSPARQELLTAASKMSPGLTKVSGRVFYWNTPIQVDPGFVVPRTTRRDTPVEDIFEEARLTYAPGAPSRLNCIYVCPILGSGFCSTYKRHPYLYKVKVWGMTFTTDGGCFTEARFNPEQAESWARQYWIPRGNITVNRAEETLVEGRVIVVGPVDL